MGKQKLSVVLPAYNEEKAIGATLDMINATLKKIKGYDSEVVVCNNNSTDRTAEIAKAKGARVVFEPKKGYGNAYKKGLKSATGNIIITGDADTTYPFDYIPELIRIMEKSGADFINTNRFARPDKKAFSFTHKLGNKMLTFANNLVFGTKIRDSQSGMWVFKRAFLDKVDFGIMSSGMPFSQEIKLYAIMLGLKFIEVPISYRARIGEVKLNTIKDGFDNFKEIIIFRKRLKSALKAADIKQRKQTKQQNTKRG